MCIVCGKPTKTTYCYICQKHHIVNPQYLAPCGKLIVPSVELPTGYLRELACLDCGFYETCLDVAAAWNWPGWRFITTTIVPPPKKESIMKKILTASLLTFLLIAPAFADTMETFTARSVRLKTTKDGRPMAMVFVETQAVLNNVTYTKEVPLFTTDPTVIEKAKALSGKKFKAIVSDERNGFRTIYAILD